MSVTSEKESATSGEKSARPTEKSPTFEDDFLLNEFGLQPTIVEAVLVEVENQKMVEHKTIVNNAVGNNIAVSETTNTEQRSKFH